VLSRRDFLDSVVQGSALALGPWACLPAASASPAPLAQRAPGAGHRGLFCALFDARSASGNTFGAQLTADGVPALPIERDVTQVWYSQLSPRWRQGAFPLAVAGLTDYAALFCLERLGWDHGLRLIYRGEHRRSASELEHRLATHVSARPELVRAVCGERWPAALAQWVAALDARSAWHDRAVSSRTPESSHHSRAEPAELDGLPLYSWVLAPKGSYTA
jgi:hypothetical protein